MFKALSSSMNCNIIIRNNIMQYTCTHTHTCTHTYTDNVRPANNQSSQGPSETKEIGQNSTNSDYDANAVNDRSSQQYATIDENWKLVENIAQSLTAVNDVLNSSLEANMAYGVGQERERAVIGGDSLSTENRDLSLQANMAYGVGQERERAVIGGDSLSTENRDLSLQANMAYGVGQEREREVIGGDSLSPENRAHTNLSLQANMAYGVGQERELAVIAADYLIPERGFHNNLSMQANMAYGQREREHSFVETEV